MPYIRCGLNWTNYQIVWKLDLLRYQLIILAQIHQLICDYLPTDRDIANYAQVCTRTSECVSSSVWRKRFLCEFDPIEQVTPKNLHDQYAERRRFSQHYFEFDNGHRPLHTECLHMLKDLIIRKPLSLGESELIEKKLINPKSRMLENISIWRERFK